MIERRIKARLGLEDGIYVMEKRKVGDDKDLPVWYWE
jgi:hypothetical protein